MGLKLDQALAELVFRGGDGGSIFETAARLLTSVTGWRFAGVGELSADGESVDVLAAAVGDHLQPVWRYELKGTPCCHVYESDISDPYWFIGSNLIEKFPDDRALLERGYHAYRGEVFFDDLGQPAGHVFCMNDREMRDDDETRWFFRMLTQRIGAEYNRMKSERELEVQRERYVLATEAGRVGVWEWDLESNAVTFAPNLEKMLGCRDGEHIRHIDDWVARVEPEFGEPMLEVARAFRDGRRQGELLAEYCVVLADGSERWFEARSHSVAGPDGKSHKLIGTDTDITERKKTERALHEAMEETERANEAKSDFLANISHELRTPLNSIIGFSDLLLTEPFGPLGGDENKEYVGFINKSGKHLLSVIGNILDLSKIEAGEHRFSEEDIDVPALIKEAEGIIFDQAAQKNLTLPVELQANLPLLRGDRIKILQVLLNLLSNAIKFTPPDGVIWVRSCLADNGDFVIGVEDTGIGIAPKDIKTVLEPFGQAGHAYTRSSDGTGLGLAIVKSIVEQHGGTLHLESDLGTGTYVAAHFPASRVVSV